FYSQKENLSKIRRSLYPALHLSTNLSKAQFLVLFKTMTPMKGKRYDYEKAISRLEIILSDIQSGKTKLSEYEKVLEEAQSIVVESKRYLRELDDSIKSLNDRIDQES